MNVPNGLSKSASNDEIITVIKPISSWQVINFKELKEYRDLFFVGRIAAPDTNSHFYHNFWKGC